MTDLRVIRRALHGLLSAVLCLVPATAQTSEGSEAIGALDCVINPSVIADLGSSAPGILAAVAVDRSDFVTAGEVIAELESGVESASVDLAKTRAESTAEVDLRRVNAAYGSRLRKRTKDLFKRKVVSTNDLDERETEARLARIQLRQALDNQSIAKHELVRAEEILKRRTIKSPITGVVMERFKMVGEYVEDQPVARVAQLDPLHVEVIVPVDHLGQVTPGMNAEVWTDVVEGKRWVAEVTRVDKVADVASGTYGVRLSLPNPDYRIPAGLRCRMQLVEGGPKPVAVNKLPVEPDTKPVVDSDDAPPEEGVAQTPASESMSEPLASDRPAEPVVEASSSQSSLSEAAPNEPDRAKAKPAMAPVSKQAATPSVAMAEVEVYQPSDVDQGSLEGSVEAVESLRSSPSDAVAESDTEIRTESIDESVVVEEPIRDETAIAESADAGRSAACRVAGPFKDEMTATRQVVKLRRAGLNADIKSVANSARVEYKVMTPVLKNPAAARAVVTKLKKAGVSDYYVYKMPADKRRVYLGVYNSKGFADKRLRALDAAGVKAYSRPSKKSGLDFFLVIRGVIGDDTASLIADLPMSKETEPEQRNFCDQLAGQ